MKKALLAVFTLILCLTLCLLASCGEEKPQGGGDVSTEGTEKNEGGTKVPGQTENPPAPEKPDQPADPSAPKEITGVTLENKTVVYNGATQSLALTGTLPAGVSAAYTYNGQSVSGVTESGNYAVRVKLTGDGYVSKELSATLTVEKAEFTGITLANQSVTYDGNAHSALMAIAGTLPAGSEALTYRLYLPDGTAVTEAVNANVYTVKVSLKNPNYKDKELSATLTVEKAEFTGITLANKSVTYDGNAHNALMAIAGTLPAGSEALTYRFFLPDGTAVDEAVNANVYTVKVSLKNPNYKDKELSATLTVEKAEFTGITLENQSVTYDGNAHNNLMVISGFLPAGSETPVYRFYRADETQITTAADADTYTVKVTLKNPNYKDLELTATLTIKASKKDLPVLVMPNGSVYFGNGLDKGRLYVLKNGTVSRVSTDVPLSFVRLSDTEFAYICGSAYLNSVKKLTIGSEKDEIKTLFTYGKFDALAAHEQELYYSVNLLTAEKSGIYKVDLLAEEPTPVKIFTGKTKCLTYENGALYFVNAADSNLSKLTLSNGAVSSVADLKVHEFVKSGNTLYLCVNGALNDYIAKLTLSDGKVTKLTDRAGEYLVIYGNSLYFSNIDLSSKLRPEEKGIWKINLSTGEIKQIVVTQQAPAGFAADNAGNLLYIDGVNLHLYTLNPATGSRTDHLDGFVAPEDTPYNRGGENAAYGGKIYFLNMFAGKTLFSYDPVTGVCIQLTTDKVADFAIIDGVLYFNQVTLMTNNDLYAVNLTSGGRAVRISTDDCRGLTGYGGYIYFVHYNAAGAAGGIGRMKTDGTEKVKFSEANGASNLRIVNDRLYYLDGGKIYFISLASIRSDSTELTGTLLCKEIKNCDQFEIDGEDLFYIYRRTLVKEVRRTSLAAPGEGQALVSSKTDPLEFIIAGDMIYYYSQAESAPTQIGIFKVSKNETTKDGPSKEMVLQNPISDAGAPHYYASSLCYLDGSLYFLNGYYFGGITNVLGDAHTYRLDLSTGTLTKLD